jgi:citrate/tricarballylate utilization protein
MPADDARAEARRVLEICNVCVYCNGLCDVFEAARRRPALTHEDLAHLANLCHACRGCLYACQYAPPHAFAVNVPRSLARLRQQLYADYAWPRALRGLLARWWLSATVGIAAITLTVAAVLAFVPWEFLFAEQRGPGAFYRVFPWEAMLLLGLLPLAWSGLALGVGLRRYWRDTRDGTAFSVRILWLAIRDGLLLRNLQGGGPGCNDLDERPSGWRRWLHQTLVLGVALSFAATLVASLYHHGLGWEAPYPPLSVPVGLGTLGGIAMSIGAAGLLWLKWRGDRALIAPEASAGEYSMLFLLLVVAATGLAVLFWRSSPAMGLLLALHLGCVLALFLLLPYGKLVHAGYRLVALMIEASERDRSRGWAGGRAVRARGLRRFRDTRTNR